MVTLFTDVYMHIRSGLINEIGCYVITVATTVIRLGIKQLNLWWRHNTGTLSALLVLSARNSPVICGLSAQMMINAKFYGSFVVISDSLLNKRWVSGEMRRLNAHVTSLFLYSPIITSKLKQCWDLFRNSVITNELLIEEIVLLKQTGIRFMPYNVRCISPYI